MVNEVKKDNLNLSMKITELGRRLADLEEEEKNLYKGEYYLYKQTLDQNKRNLCCYIHERLKRIREVFWENLRITDEVKKRMGKMEVIFMESYVSSITDFKENIDLMENLEPVVTDLYVNVQVIQGMGIVTTIEGMTYNFEKNRILNMKKKEAEPFVNSGVLREMS